MAQFRTTSDILDLALTNGGEVTNGNSPYEAQVLNYLNRVHFAIVAGGTIPVGGDSTITIDEAWPWARARLPLILELQPAYETGTIILTQGSEAGTFSSAPAASLQGWYIQVEGRKEWLRIGNHTGGATAFEIDGAYPDSSVSGSSFTAVKLDYDLIPSFIVIDSSNNKIQVQKVSGSTLTGTLTAGVYSPSDLATHVAAVMTTALSGPTVTGSYSSTTRKFSFLSDLAGTTSFFIVGNGDQSAFSAHKILGFDDETTSHAATQTSTYVLGGIARLIEAMKLADGAKITGLDPESFHRSNPFSSIYEGVPTRYAVVNESPEGTITVRFNAYPDEKTRVEVDHVPVPRDLKDSSASIPLIPRKWSDVLEDAATFYLMLNKSDDRMQLYANLMQGKLKAMIAQYRGSLQKTGENFGQVIARGDKVVSRRSRLSYGYEAE